MPQPTCTMCGTPIVRVHPTGPLRTYCSASCRNRRSDRDRVKPIRRCITPDCDEACAGTSKWCLAHRDEMRKQKRRQASPDSPTDICTTEDCDRPLRARGMCNMHYKRWSRSEGRSKNPEWNDRRRDNYHARRARSHGAHNGDRALLSDIIDRDGTDCKGCHTPVDLDLSWPNPLSKSIDHTIPLSRGGTHSLANTQLMHLTCNTAKGASLAA